jgi:hypothetical protein
MPGFTLYVFPSANYQGTAFLLDNSYGINILNQATVFINQGSSCILEYNGSGYIYGNYVNNSLIFINNISGSLAIDIDVSGTMIPNNLPFQILNNNQDTSLVTSSYSPGIPGAYLMNGVNPGVGSFPIFCSINYSTFGMNDIDDNYLVMPGYKIIVYVNDNYGGNSTTIDNTASSSILFQATSNVNQGSSCKLYYNGVEIVISGFS